MFPLWHKVVLATGITVYCCLKDTFLQYIMNYNEGGKVLLSKLPNPDYYGRLGGACFDTLVQKMKKIKMDDQQKFLSFVFQYEFSSIKPPPANKLSTNFIKHFAKLEQSFNKEKYISGNVTNNFLKILGFNFISSSTTKVHIDLESTTKMALRESVKQSRKLQRNQTTRSWQISSSDSNVSSRKSSLSSKTSENNSFLVEGNKVELLFFLIKRNN
jgi:hypothetical protein